jgi:hypothetical protein
LRAAMIQDALKGEREEKKKKLRKVTSNSKI